ncbi:hypothetical protein [uncultured Winogradskyella sp.]|uniref:hypothetical protein n=1 Tax=uncultured Winogradskyella sp. TaxID=395353 RepID=UPI00262BA241|nr:hypothetical protein [uncultured Winogradskyella sp.]|tara:strand:+ start:970 stop:1299 length:330 start_codon:yes stop_codon:yes gene_type:complete
MDLEITNSNNRYQVKGTLNKVNLKTFNLYFANIFDKLDEVLLDIEGVRSIDRAGVMALARLHNESITKSKILSITGLGCKELYQHFKTEKPKQETSNNTNIATGSVVAA